MASEEFDESRATVLHGSESVYDLFCNVCDQDGRHIEAYGFCCDCQDFLCNECFDSHLRPRPSRHHTLQGREHMPKRMSKRQNKDICTELCCDHKNEIVKYFCSDHGELGCGVCMTLNHRNCKGMDYIADIADDFLTSREFQDIEQKTQTLTTETEFAIQKQRDIKEDVITQIVKDINATAVKLEKVLVDDINKIRDNDTISIQSSEGQCTSLLHEIKSLKSKCSTLQKDGQNCNLFIAMKRVWRKLAEIEENVLKLRGKSSTTKYTIKVNGCFDDSFAKVDFISSEIEGAEPSIDKTNVSSINGTLNEFQTNELKPSRDDKENLYKLPIHVADIPVKVKQDKHTPIITGCVALSENRIVLIDTKTCTLKLLNVHANGIISHLDCDSQIGDITVVGDDQVAVTCRRINKIRFVNVKGCLEIDHFIHVNGPCEGIASISDNFVVSYENHAKLDIINKAGKLVKIVVAQKRGKQLFKSIVNVAVSQDQHSIYIADYDSGTVTSLGIKGNVKATYKSPDLWGPRGMTIDSAGLLYVCGWYTSNVHLLTPDLNRLDIVLTKEDRLNGPSCLAYCKKTEKLFLAMSACNIIKVYSIG